MAAGRIAILALRDLLVVAATGALVVLDRSAHGAGVLGGALAVLTGFMITFSGFYAHEWGHYLAARFAGAAPVPAASVFSIYLFELREQDCTRAQWLTMSLGGYAATIVALPIILALIDLSSMSGRVTLVLSGLGVLATFALELPITYRVYRKTAAS